ncbi:transglycosylase SLT domain-containing protein [Nocardia sp. NPDC056611]|uniref:transglycosylase SLT domain-containing protein n=1 Tax=Nocardia sp. NPDC056611 TaxID=3345877 RepID=UPI0036734BE7
MASVYSAGVAKIVIRPDLSGFKEKLETEIKAAIAGAGKSIPVTLELDAASVAKARKEANAGGPVTLDARVSLRDRTVREAQAKAQGQAGTIHYNAEVRNDRDSAARAGREAARAFNDGYRQEDRRASRDANRRVGANETAANRDANRYSSQRPLNEVEKKAADDYREASRRLDGYNRRFAAADRAVAKTEARVAALMRERATDLNALWRRETTRITREIDTLRGAGPEGRSVGQALTRSTRSRRINDLQRQLREDPSILEGRAASAALEQRLREAQRQLDVRRDVRRTVGARRGDLTNNRSATERAFTDLVRAGNLAAQQRLARQLSAVDTSGFAQDDRPLARVEAQAARLLRGRMMDELPLSGDRKAITNAFASASRLESAERTLLRTRMNLERATTAVSKAEKSHADLVASGETDVRRLAQSRQRIDDAQTMRRYAYNDRIDASRLFERAGTHFDHDQAALGRRVNLPRLQRSSEWIDAKAEKALEGISQKLLFVGRMLSSVMTIAMSAGVALAAVGAVNLVPVIASISQMGTALAALPALAAMAAATVATIAVGFVGVKDSLKAESDLRNQTALQAETQADKVADAQRKVRDADRAVSDAVRDQAITRSDGADKIVASEKRVQDAQRSAMQAQKDLSTARRDAVDRINDYNRAVRGIPLSEHQAETRYLRAQNTLSTLWKNKDATWLDYREAMDSVEQAKQDWENTIADNQKLQRNALEANAKGVEGDDTVVKSKQAVVDAIGNVHDAEKDRQKTVRDVAIANANAENAVTKALEAQQDAIRAQQKSYQSDAQTRYLDSLTKLSPNARAFVEQLHAMDGTLKDLRRTVQDSLFENLASDLDRVGGKILPTVKDGFAGIAGGINNGVRGAVRSLSTEVGQLNLRTFFDESTRAASRFGDAFAPATSSLLNLMSSGGAFLPRITGNLAEWATKFDNRVSALRESGELATMIDRGMTKAAEVGVVLKDSFGVVKDIFHAISGEGDGMLSRFESRLKDLRARLQSTAGQDSVRAFFRDVSEVWNKWSTLVGNAISLVTNALYPAFQNTYGALFALASTILGAFASLEKYAPVLQYVVTALLGLRIVGSIAGTVDRLGQSLQNFAMRPGWDVSRSPISGIGAALSRWSGYIGAAVIALGLFSQKSGELDSKLNSVHGVQDKFASYGAEFKQKIKEALGDSGNIVDDSVRGVIGSQFQSFLSDFQTLKSSDIANFSDAAMVSLKNIFGGASNWNDAKNSANASQWGSMALDAWDKLKVPIKSVQDAVGGTNDQFEAFKQRIIDVAGQNSGYLIPVLDSMRQQFIKGQDAASKTVDVYDKIREKAVGAADAVDVLRNAFKKQQQDALALENASSAAYANQDSLRDLLKGNDTTGPLKLSGLLVDGTNELNTKLPAARELSQLLQDIGANYRGVAVAEYTSTYNQTQDIDQARKAQAAKVKELRDTLIGILDPDHVLSQEQIDAVLARYHLMTQQLADAPPPEVKLKVNTDELDQAVVKLRAIVQQLNPESGFAPFFKDALKSKEKLDNNVRAGSTNPYDINLADKDRSFLSQLTTDGDPNVNTSAAYYKALAKKDGIDDVLAARTAVLEKLARGGTDINAMTLAQLQGTNVALGLKADDLRYLNLDNIHSAQAQQGTQPAPAAQPQAQPEQPQQQPQAAQPGQAQPQQQPGAQPAAQPAADQPKPAADQSKPPVTQQVPDFAPANTSFTAFADEVAKAKKDKLDPALSDLAVKAAAVGQAVVDARNVATPAFDDLVKLFTDRITGEQGLLPVWGRLKTTIDADVTTITGEYWAKRLVDALTTLTASFGTGVTGVGTQWSGIKKAIADPLNVVFTQIFGVSLKNAWTELKKVLPSLPDWTANIPQITGYNTGGIHGVMSGWSPGVDDRLIAVSGGEAIMRPEWTRAVTPEYVHGANAAARRGGVAGVRDYISGLEHYASGGIAGGTVATDEPISAVQRSLWNAVRTAFPGAVLTSATRTIQTEGHQDYHNTGNAIDLGGPMDQIARWIYQRYPQSTELIHWPLNGWQNLKNGKPLDYGAKTNQDHIDHVHWANLGQILSDGRMISMATGGVGSFVSDLQDQINNLLVQPMQKALAGVRGTDKSLFGGVLPTDFGKTVTDAAVTAVQQLAGAVGGPVNYLASAGTEQWRSLVEKVLREKGLPLSETNRVLMQMGTESSGNPRAINLWDRNALAGTPSKGLMQLIDSTFRAYADAGYDKDIYDPESNIRASINYALKDPKYGSLAAAYQGHGYDNGGWLQDGGIGWNKSGEPEPVFTGDQWRKIQSLIGNISDLVGIIAPQNVSALPVLIADLSTKFIDKMKALLQEVFGKNASVSQADQGTGSTLATGGGTTPTSDQGGTTPTGGGTTQNAMTNSPTGGTGVDSSLQNPGDTSANGTGLTPATPGGATGQTSQQAGNQSSVMPSENANVGEDIMRDALTDMLSPEQLDALFPSTKPKTQAQLLQSGGANTPATTTPAATTPEITPAPDATVVPDMAAMPTPTTPDPASLAVAPEQPKPENAKTEVVQASPYSGSTPSNVDYSASTNAAKYASLTPNAMGKKLVHMGLGFIDGNVRQFLSDVGLPGGGALGNALDQAVAYKKSKDQESYAEKQAQAAGNVHYHVSDIDEAMRKETIRRWQQTLGFK